MSGTTGTESMTPEQKLPAKPTSISSSGGRVMLDYGNVPPDLAEAVRGILNRHELREQSALPATIAVTGPSRGVGTSTVSQALATILAQELGRFVCWIDCSWMRPDAAGGTDGQAPDLIDILQDHSRLSSAFTSSEQLPQLVCLAPGAVPDESRNQIVRSPELQELLQILSEEFDHLVFDVPPVLGHANSLTLLRWADASLLVVKHRGTTVSEVRRSLETMDPTPNLGVVLNQYRTRIPAGVRRLLGE